MATAPSRATFLASIYGNQFNSAPVAVIDAAIAAAARRTSGLFQNSTQEQDAVMIQAALLLLKHPEARAMRSANEGIEIEWAEELCKIRRAGMMGLRVF